MKNAVVGVKKANAAVEFKRINLDFEGFNSQIDYPENIFAFQIPFLDNNIIMFTFEDYDNKYSEYNAFGYHTPIILLSKKGSFVDLDEEDKQHIIEILDNINIQRHYLNEEELEHGNKN